MMKRASQAFVLILVIIAMMPSFMSAQEVEDKVVKPKAPKHIYLKLLHGRELNNHDNEVIGAVDEVIIDLVEFKIQFAVVETGGELGLGDRWTAVPYSLLNWRMDEESEEPKLVADISQRQIEIAPRFDYERLAEHLADENWRRQTRAAFGTYPEDAVLPALKHADERVVAGQDQSVPADPVNHRFRRSQNLKALLIQAREDLVDTKAKVDASTGTAQFTYTDAGEIQDFILNCDQAVLTALVLEVPSNPVLPANKFIVPTAALKRLKPDTDEFSLERRRTEFKDAPGLKIDAIESLADPEACKALRSFWQTRTEI